MDPGCRNASGNPKRRSEVMEPLKKLQDMRRRTGAAQTPGLEDSVIETFLKTDRQLAQAIDSAYQEFLKLQEEFGAKLQLPEAELIDFIQSDFVNFYEADA